MATIVLSAAGMALGGSIGGSVLGISTAVVGRAAGAALGRVIDERILGAGSAAVETGRVDRFRLTGASEGAAVAQVHGRMRVAGQVIWAGPFEETRQETRASKWGGQPAQTSFAYRISLAVALCEGAVTRVGRVWADGVEVARDALNLRFYPGSEDQLPDPLIAAAMGAGVGTGTGAAPAYRGIAYVVLEQLELGRFGNRVPQLSFEVFRPGAVDDPTQAEDMARLVRAVAMIPGTGEYALATEPVYMDYGFGERVPANLNTPSGQTDLVTSLTALEEELPNCGSVSLVVSWFGDDLRAGDCTIRPKVEQTGVDGRDAPWRVSGLTRSAAQAVAQIAGRPVYGGTPSDASVMQAIAEMRARGKSVVFYPFILMEQMAGNSLPDPWTGMPGQPPLPWRGRITTSLAPGIPGTPDRTAAAEAEVAAFFGTAAPGDFQPGAHGVGYSGPAEWSLRRFILHYAHLCAAAGGVDAFCISSEMVALTQIRGAKDSFPAVAALRALAADVRAILGPGTKIGYAADWSEYHGYQPVGTGDKYFHLDPLWADPAIDFIGIDNYMPLSDWRDGEEHLDAHWGSIHDLDYLTGNVAGGEGFDWFYHSPEARDAQIRTPITDFRGEDWVWRYKDLRGWWSHRHHDRIGGARSETPTAWEPGSKPIWFTEIGCAAIDKGTNQPNKFLDPKSSESSLPYFSTGLRDDYIQIQYLRALYRHFGDPVANPLSEVYGGRMVDMDRAHVWAWDARPWPQFPGNRDLWSDGDNYARGHWINGRTNARPLAAVVAEICAEAGVTAVDTRALHGVVRGYQVASTQTARAMLQTLMVAYGFDAVERDGKLVFITRKAWAGAPVDPAATVLDGEAEVTLERARSSQAEVIGQVRITHAEADGDYELRSAEARFGDDPSVVSSDNDLPLALTRGEARAIAERWLAEARVARDTVRLALPPSRTALGPGDVITLPGDEGAGRYRIDRVEDIGHRRIEAVRVEPEVYLPQPDADEGAVLRSFAAPVPVEALFMDLPLMRGDEVPHAPHAGFAARPWPGAVALHVAQAGGGYALDSAWPVPACVGVTQTPLFRADPAIWDRGPALRVRLITGSLAPAGRAEVLAGANLAAIGSGGPDGWELFQFADAELVAPDIWDLRMRLRGVAGTDGIAPADWPVGSRFVLIDARVAQIGLPPNQRGVERTYRWGPAARALDDPSYREASLAFVGNGLRPYAVAHLRVAGDGAGGHLFGWRRRSRIGGDAWGPGEVPLGEEAELYTLRVIAEGVTRREVTVTAPGWSYPAAARAADGIAGAFRVEVAQVSASFGPGPARAIEIDG